MELELRQKVTGGDADKRAGGEGQGRADDLLIRPLGCAGAKLEYDDTQRDGQRVKAVYQVPARGRTTGDGHQRAERERIERVVEENHKEHGASGPRGIARAHV